MRKKPLNYAYSIALAVVEQGLLRQIVNHRLLGILTLSVLVTGKVGTSGAQIYRAISPELRGVRNSRSYNWKKQEILKNIGWFWGALPP